MLRLEDLKVDSFATGAIPSGPVTLTTAGYSHLGCTDYSCYTFCAE